MLLLLPLLLLLLLLLPLNAMLRGCEEAPTAAAEAEAAQGSAAIGSPSPSPPPAQSPPSSVVGSPGGAPPWVLGPPWRWRMPLKPWPSKAPPKLSPAPAGTPGCRGVPETPPGAIASEGLSLTYLWCRQRWEGRGKKWRRKSTHVTNHARQSNGSMRLPRLHGCDDGT